MVPTKKKTTIKLTNVSKTFKQGNESIHALKNIDLEIRQGEYLAIVGPSGSGKSTLLHLIGGLIKPTEGSIEVEGRLIRDLNDDQLSAYRNEKIGFIFQDFKLLPHLTVEENVHMPLRFAHENGHKDVENILKMVDIFDRREHRPSEISGGQKQRAAIARALVNEPAIIIADEPTGNLDSMTGKKIIDLMKKAHTKTGVTLIVVTHDTNVAKHASRIIEIHDGELKTKNSFDKFFA